jgi:hypothetical protein
VIGGVCTFRGEEKRLGFTGTHPKAELFDKLVGWYYDPAPYVFGRLFHLPSPSFFIILVPPGYYAVGHFVTLAAIAPLKLWIS